MSVSLRYTEYEVIDLSLDGVDQLNSVLEQLMVEKDKRGEEGGSRQSSDVIKETRQQSFAIEVVNNIT